MSAARPPCSWCSGRSPSPSATSSSSIGCDCANGRTAGGSGMERTNHLARILRAIALAGVGISFLFAPPLLVLLPLALYFQDLHLNNTYVGLVWIYQLIALPLILWIVRGYFEDSSPDIEHAYRIDGHSWLRTFFRIAIPLARPG